MAYSHCMGSVTRSKTKYSKMGIKPNLPHFLFLLHAPVPVPSPMHCEYAMRATILVY